MPEETTKNENPPGLTVEHFKIAVAALSNLLESGKFLFFLPRKNWLRIVGDKNELRQQLNEIAGEDAFDENDTIDALDELQLFCGAQLRYPRIEFAVKLIEENAYDIFFNEAEEEDQNTYREILKDKLTRIKEEQWSTGLRERIRRFRTTTSASLEELDVEIIKERRDEVEGSTIETPFMRLRFRYSKETPGGFPFGLMLSGPGQGVPVDSFELECDQSDIDFLIMRLIDAKRRLMANDEPPGED